MTAYKEIKRELEKLFGVKAENIFEQAKDMAEKPLAACRIKNDSYEIYIFKLSEIEYDIREDGSDYTIYDKIFYYAVETNSRRPVSWHHASKGGPWTDEVWTGLNYSIEWREISDDSIDYKIMFALYNCGHLGHFEESSLFD